MEHQKILHFLYESKDSTFLKRKWSFVNDNSKSNYDATNEITYNTSILKSKLCDYNDAYILMKGDITLIAASSTEEAIQKLCTIY